MLLVVVSALYEVIAHIQLRRRRFLPYSASHYLCVAFASTPPHPGSSKWFLDSSASFHMTRDPTHLSSLSSPHLSSIVHIANGTLTTSSFHVSTVSHVPQLTMQLIFTGQVTDHSCHIILEANSCSVWDICTRLLVGTGPRCHDSHG